MKIGEKNAASLKNLGDRIDSLVNAQKKLIICGIVIAGIAAISSIFTAVKLYLQ